jgi:hypothetical protein
MARSEARSEELLVVIPDEVKSYREKVDSS